MSNIHKCAVRSCQSENNKLFRCPESRNQSKKWKSILGVSDKEFYVCELHFDANFISYEKVLDEQAVPTIFINDNLQVNRFCASCSIPISEGHQIGLLHLEIYRILFRNFDMIGEFVCSNCNDKMLGISDFIRIVEDSRKRFKSIDAMKEQIVKIEPIEHDIVKEEETEPFQHDSIFLKTEYNSDSEQEEYESESSEKSMPKPKSKMVRKRIRKCEICMFTSSDRDEFVKHIKSIHGTNSSTTEVDYDLKLEIDDPHVFVGTKQSKECDICREVFTDRMLLIEHFKAHFDKDRIYACPYCNKNCKGIVMLGFHKNLDHKVDRYYCICHRTYDREFVMKRCRKNHQNTLVDEKYVCDECDSYVAFGDSLRLAHHKTKIHGNGVKYWCTVCLKSYSNNEFKQCMKKHRAEITTMTVKCPECDKTMQYQRFKDHYKDLHVGDKNEICEVCGLGFSSKPSLSNHKRMRHTTLYTNFNYECDFCGNKFNSKGNLLSHMSSHRYQETYQCSICLKKNLTKLNFHMKRYHPNNYDSGVRANPETNLYHCPNCVQNFTSLNFYDRHVERNTCSVIGECEVDVTKKVGSRTEGKFPCKLCKTVVKNIVRLKVHINQIHTGTKECPVCNKTSKNKRQLGKHLRRQHNMSIKEFKNI
ncbi:zinc finger protein 260-like [Chironomus tepperi]|uniref:zinc finger protein 260-like n=1 Tax=Chironomus tepperi TaxID=113505 RepID=UPI00391F59C6